MFVALTRRWHSIKAGHDCFEAVGSVVRADRPKFKINGVGGQVIANTHHRVAAVTDRVGLRRRCSTVHLNMTWNTSRHPLVSLSKLCVLISLGVHGQGRSSSRRVVGSLRKHHFARADELGKVQNLQILLGVNSVQG